MSRITDYKVIQADGNRELAKEVKRFIDEGWEPSGSVLLVGTKTPGGLPFGGESDAQPIVRIYAQPIVKREPEHAEIKRLRDLERHVSGIVEQLDNPCTGETGMLTFAHEELQKGLRGGPLERKV